MCLARAQTNLGNKILLSINNQIEKDGFYALGLDNENVADLAFNFDRNESNMEVASNADLTSLSNNANINLLDASLNANFSSYITQMEKELKLQTVRTEPDLGLYNSCPTYEEKPRAQKQDRAQKV